MTDSILIIGGGVAGLAAALDCAAAGARSIVVEQDAIVGGRLAAGLTQKSSVGDSAAGMPIPKLDVVVGQDSIEIITLADVQQIAGRPGNFDVTIRERARFVTDACTRCNHCKPVCPVVRENEHDAGLTFRKAIYTPLPETLPQEFVIDIDACLNSPPNYLPCNRCTEVCDDDAIHFDVALEREHHRQVGAVIVTAGVGIATDSSAKERGYGSHADIVTTAELERLLTAPGPTGGFAAKPSNEEYVNSILLVLNELLPRTVHIAASQVERLVEQNVGRIALLVTALPANTERERLQQRLPDGLTVNYGLLQTVEARADNRIAVKYADLVSSRIPEEHYDMVVLGSDIGPAAGIDALAQVLGCDLDDAGYVATPSAEDAGATSCPGVYAAGGATGSLVLHDVIEEARAAAGAALTYLDPRLLDSSRIGEQGGAALPEATRTTEADLQARFEQALHVLLQES